MSKNRRGRGKAFTPAEDREILLGLHHGLRVPVIAKQLGRGRSTVFYRIARMKASSQIHQTVMDLGPLQGAGDDSPSV